MPKLVAIAAIAMTAGMHVLVLPIREWPVGLSVAMAGLCVALSLLPAMSAMGTLSYRLHEDGRLWTGTAYLVLPNLPERRAEMGDRELGVVWSRKPELYREWCVERVHGGRAIERRVVLPLPSEGPARSAVIDGVAVHLPVVEAECAPSLPRVPFAWLNLVWAVLIGVVGFWLAGVTSRGFLATAGLAVAVGPALLRAAVAGHLAQLRRERVLHLVFVENFALGALALGTWVLCCLATLGAGS